MCGGHGSRGCSEGGTTLLVAETESGCIRCTYFNQQPTVPSPGRGRLRMVIKEKDRTRQNE